MDASQGALGGKQLLQTRFSFWFRFQLVSWQLYMVLWGYILLSVEFDIFGPNFLPVSFTT